MAFLAFSQDVSSGQREFRYPVIELDFAPRLLMVAGFAFLPLLAFMLVVFLMASEAIGFQLVLVQIAFVASNTLGIFVFSEQRIFGLLVMVEDDFLPALFVVAGFTFGTEVALVLVIFLMA